MGAGGMPQPRVTTPHVPAGWRISPCTNGAVDLRVTAERRPYLVAAAAAGAVAWTVGVLAAMVAHRTMPLAAPPVLALTLAFLMIAFTVWCAFGDERWRLSGGVVEHRVGLRRWAYVRRIESRAATLMITVDYTANFGKPYFRLYALASGKRYFLFERDYSELKTLAAVIGSYTGWATPGPDDR